MVSPGSSPPNSSVRPRAPRRTELAFPLGPNTGAHSSFAATAGARGSNRRHGKRKGAVAPFAGENKGLLDIFVPGFFWGLASTYPAGSHALASRGAGRPSAATASRSSMPRARAILGGRFRPKEHRAMHAPVSYGSTGIG